MTDYVKRVFNIATGESTDIPMTPEEIAQRQAEEALPKPPPSIAEQLEEVFRTLPVEVRAQFYPLKAGIKVALEERDLPMAKAIIQGATVPYELKGTQQSLLQVFP